ncbi:GNAT family N-acetyltransferase [Streptomyces sp. NPDC048639]|uniref:GNAT family N-acetyltransferase n=1 Tax=Streptomyces sp. NPDC048639 TaxID=3365581 RepID=UPI003721D4E8
MDVRIRAAHPEEYAPLGEITARAYLADGLLDFGDDDPYLEHLRDVGSRAEHTRVLVAVDSGSGELLGGVAFVAPGSRYANVARPGEGEFRMLAVAPSARRRGAAEKLVRACIGLAREQGLDRMVLSSHERMRTAHRLYERLGFVRAPERDWSPLPDLGPLWVFTSELGPQSGSAPS